MATDEDLLAAEWESVSDSSTDDSNQPANEASSGNSEPVLNQDEIDSLLGLEENEDEDLVTGIQAIVESAMVSYERLPMLEIVFDRLLRMMSTSLRNLTSDNVEVSLDSITSIRFGDYLETIPMPAMLSVFKAEEWDNFGLMVVTPVSFIPL